MNIFKVVFIFSRPYILYSPHDQYALHFRAKFYNIFPNLWLIMSKETYNIMANREII
jgi:hypothetical protein